MCCTRSWDLRLQQRGLAATCWPEDRSGDLGRASFLESRLAYRIQELAYGGLKHETIERLEALAEGLNGNNAPMRRRRGMSRPIAGTMLVREWQGAEHRITVLNDGYEYQGRAYKSLSAIARTITGTRWNGWVFWGLKNQRARR